MTPPPPICPASRRLLALILKVRLGRLAAASALGLSASVLTCCTVDSNARLTIGGETNGRTYHNAYTGVALPGMTPDTDQPNLRGASTSTADRSKWPVVVFEVPSRSVRHGAYIDSTGSLTNRAGGEYPDEATSLGLHDAAYQTKATELALVPLAIVKDAAVGLLSTIWNGPFGWTSSPSSDHDRFPAEDWSRTPEAEGDRQDESYSGPSASDA